MNKPNKPANNGSVWKVAGLVTALGIDFAVCTVGGFFLGSWQDKLWSGNGLGIGLGVLIGIVVGIIGIVALIQPVMRRK